MSGLGEILKTERIKRAISIDQISKITNISEKQLYSLENNQFHLIPGKFYLKTFLKSYLNAIDINEEVFFKQYKEHINSIQFENAIDNNLHYNKLRFSRFKKRNIWLYLILLGIILVIVFFMLLSNNETIAGIFQTKSRQSFLPETGIINTLEKQIAFSDFSPINIEFHFLEDCWVQVHRGKKKIIQQICRTGEKITIDGYDLLITLGNPSVVEFYLNNQKISNLKKIKTPLKFRLNPQNLNSFLKQ